MSISIYLPDPLRLFSLEVPPLLCVYAKIATHIHTTKKNKLKKVNFSNFFPLSACF